MIPRILIFPAALSLLAACGAGDLSHSAIVRDSAGITITESPGPVWADGEGWTLSPEPVVRLGSVDDDPRYQLYGVRGALRLGDGRLVVANAGTSEIRYYAADGSHLRSAGGEGRGPEEFRRIFRMFPMEGDSVLVFDGALFRFSVLDPGGAIVRTFRFDPVGEGFVWPVVYLGDGFILGASGQSMGSRTGAGVQRDTALYLRFDLDGTVTDTIGSFPAGERYVSIDDGVRTSVSRPFARETQVAVDGRRRRLYVGTGDAYQVQVRTPTGGLQGIFRGNRPPLPVQEAHIARYTEERLSRVAPQRQASERRILSEMPFPDRFPAYARLIVDADGHLWVKDYPRPGDSLGTWRVFSPEGRLLGAVPVPAGVEILQIGADAVVGVDTDELGVERVHAYTLDRSP